ncbi:MAG: lactate utilization protein [Coprobacillus sp.]
MEENLKKILKIKENQMIKAFELNQMSLMFVKDQRELETFLKSVLKDNKKVAVGGSVTLDEMKVLDLIRNSDVDFIDRYEKEISREEMEDRFRQAFFADLFITSTNALTMDGHLYNIDGTGNRVAAMIYGPKEVIVIAGLNKICEDEKAAIDHIKKWSAPANAVRLNKNTPCAKTGQCQECHSADRICSSYVKLGYQKNASRMMVIIVKENLGY